MAISPLFIPAFSIEDVLLDKDTGAPLSGGLVYFEEDNQRGTLKPIYQITGSYPNYTFIELTNPMVLSSIGTFQDSLGNPVVPYFYPWTAALAPDYYYVRVLSAGMVPQFDRESVPYLGNQSESDVLSVITNELSNPQFLEVNFDTSSPDYVYSVNAASSQVINLAPDWDLIVSSSGAGTITVNQLAPAGTVNVPTNPATILNINNAGLSQILLRQRITGSPNLWGDGYLAGTFVAKTYSGTTVTLGMFYSQSSGTVTAQQIVSAMLPSSGIYQAFPGTTSFIPISNSTDQYPNGYIDIYFVLPLSIEIDITSVMVAFTGSQTSIADINFDQESPERQIDHLFHYWKPRLDYKPIPSYLVGWDFPFNPSQFFANGSTSLGATGDNKSKYVWDQTIAFQSVDSSISTARNNANNGLNITTANSTTWALVQYLPGNTSREALTQRLSSKLGAMVDSGTLKGTVSLWWTTGSLPSISSNLSLVSGVAAGGIPSCANGTWVQVNNPNYASSCATFKLTTSTQSFDFSGFFDTMSGSTTAAYLAIVIAFDTMTAAQTATINYCSLTPGDIPTRPAPQTPDEVLRECQYYYRKSFQTNTTPAQNIGTGTGESYGVQAVGAGTANSGPFVRFDYPMIALPLVTLYSPGAASAQVYNETHAGDYSGTSSGLVTPKGFTVNATSNSGSVAGNLIGVHWTADTRLGTF